MTAFKHTALVCSQEENADRFYRQLLGLEKATAKVLPQSLAKAIFNIDAELNIINYTGAGIHFEIFIAQGQTPDNEKIAHTGIEVDDRRLFLDACRNLGIWVNQVEKGEKVLLFVRDFDDNLFEVKTLKP